MHKSTMILLGSIGVLFSLGLMMVFNTTSAEAIDKLATTGIHIGFFKQLIFASFGVALGCGIYFLGYENLFKWAPVLFWGSVVSLAFVFIPGIGQEINGAKRWISIGGFSFQPSEILKITLPIYFIHWRLKIKEIHLKEFALFSIKLAFPFALIFFEPDNGATFLLFLSLITLFLLMKVPAYYWAIPLAILSLIGGAIALNMPYVRARLKVYLDPESDLRGKGHQPYQAKIAAGSGKLWGKGLGKSIQKLNYLPEARSDYIAAIFAEEFGFIGMTLLIGLYVSLILSGFIMALQVVDVRGFYLTVNIIFLMAFQVFLNLGVVSGLLPSKGTTLPFFSQGGSSLLVNILAIFIIVQISQSSRERRNDKKTKASHSYRHRRVRRTPSSGSKACKYAQK